MSSRSKSLIIALLLSFLAGCDTVGLWILNTELVLIRYCFTFQSDVPSIQLSIELHSLTWDSQMPYDDYANFADSDSSTQSEVTLRVCCFCESEP